MFPERQDHLSKEFFFSFFRIDNFQGRIRRHMEELVESLPLYNYYCQLQSIQLERFLT